MSRHSKMAAGLVAIALSGPISGCRRDAAPAEATGDCEVRDVSGRTATTTLDALDDPVARLVLRGACPADFTAVQAKLADADATGCEGDMFAADRTTLVSERAQLRGVADGDVGECTPTPAALFRGLVQHTCGGRQPWELWLSVVPFATVTDQLPKDLEAIGWDRTRSEFNFYTLEDGAWHFHGGSRDMLRGMEPDGRRRCAACHVGGGLVMKELDNPWVYWEGRLTTPGVDALLEAHALLGSRTGGKVLDFRPAGKELEDAIEAGNAAWTETRVAHLREHGTLQELLRPLFCTPELNLAAATETASPPWQTRATEGALRPSAALLVGSRLAPEVALVLPLSAYHAELTRVNQRVQSQCGAALLDAEGRPVVDAPFDLIHPRRARIDEQYVAALVDARIIDAELADAVVAVDMSRPIFSEARCGLVDALPDLPPAERTAAKMRVAVTAAVAELDTPAAAELRRNLDDHASIAVRVRHFLTTCAARPPAELTRDIVEWVSHLRRLARRRHVVELAEMLPVDDLPERPGLHFDPGTCRLAD